MVTWTCIICGKQASRTGTKIGTFCSVECKSEFQRRKKPSGITKDWLKQKYLTERLSANDIAKVVGRDPKRVWEWLRNYGIPTRPRGAQSSPGTFKKGNISPTTGTHRPESVKQALREARRLSPNLPHLIGGIHYLKGKRGAETPNWKGGCTPERQAFYSSPEWKAVVVAVWQRDEAHCQRCRLDSRILKHEEIRFAIHHIESFAIKEKRADPDNLVLLCRQCHLWVHSAENMTREFIKR